MYLLQNKRLWKILKLHDAPEAMKLEVAASVKWGTKVFDFVTFKRAADRALMELRLAKQGIER